MRGRTGGFGRCLAARTLEGIVVGWGSIEPLLAEEIVEEDKKQGLDGAGIVDEVRVSKPFDRGRVRVEAHWE